MPSCSWLQETFEKFLPRDSRRRYYCDLCFKTVKVFFQQGPIVLLIKAKRWYQLLKENPNTKPQNCLNKPNGTKKNVLVIEDSVPRFDTSASHLRLFNILKILVSNQHNVTFMGENPSDKRYTQLLKEMGINVIFSPNLALTKRYISNLGNYFDLVILSLPQIAEKYLDIVRTNCPKAKIVYDTTDLVFLRESRRAVVEKSDQVAKQAEKLKERDLFLVRHCDITLVVSEVEKQILFKEDSSLDVRVLSTIHEIYVPRKKFSERKDLLFVGGFGHPPNEDAVLFFVKDILPSIKEQLPNSKFYIVGNNPSKKVQALNTNDVIVTGYVEDLTPYFENCRIFVSPIRYGAGVKGKINQSMSYGLPVVTTSIGAEGMYLVDGENALIADNPEEFAEKIVRVYGDENLWLRLSQNSIKNVERHFSFEAASQTLEGLLK